MARSLKFHLDEQMDRAIARALRGRGIDVTTTVDMGLRSSSDITQLNYCLSSQRVLITCDTDFITLHQQGIQHFGIVKFRDDQRRSIGPVVRFIDLVWEVMEPEEMLQYLLFA